MHFASHAIKERCYDFSMEQSLDRPPMQLPEHVVEALAARGGTMGVSVITTDLDGTINRWNLHAEELFGWKAEEVLGKSIMDITVGPVNEEIAQDIMDQLAAGNNWIGQFEARRKDGTLISIQINDAPIINDRGEIIGIAGISHLDTGRATELLERLDEMRSLASKLDSVRSEEQRRISAQLHDYLSQPISFASMQLKGITGADDLSPATSEKLEQISDLLDNALRTLQGICGSLRPAELDHYLAVIALEELGTSWANRTGIEIDVAIDPVVDELDRGLLEIVVQIITEALSNIERHACATKASIELEVDGEVLTTIIRDNGKGYDEKPGFGVRLMQERANRIGGTMTIESDLTNGTIVVFAAPTATPNSL